jgi:hypothetical protein
MRRPPCSTASSSGADGLTGHPLGWRVGLAASDYRPAGARRPSIDVQPSRGSEPATATSVLLGARVGRILYSPRGLRRSSARSLYIQNVRLGQSNPGRPRCTGVGAGTAGPDAHPEGCCAHGEGCCARPAGPVQTRRALCRPRGPSADPAGPSAHPGWPCEHPVAPQPSVERRGGAGIHHGGLLPPTSGLVLRYILRLMTR